MTSFLARAPLRRVGVDRKTCRITVHAEQRASHAIELSLTEHAESLAEDGWTLLNVEPALAQTLRGEYVNRFNNPLDVNPDRFIWDYWYVPGQYQLLRTTAERFFSTDAYVALEEALLRAAAQLGCRSMSQPWISYYVDGCRQEIHTDAPHGPFAFVLSLTDWESRRFDGGETLILKETSTLLSGTQQHAREKLDLFHHIPPRLGQITVFDGRLPHMVSEVRGVRDPLLARVVVHGWFTEPSPYFDGDIQEDIATDVINSTLSGIFEEIQNRLPPATGTLIARLTVNRVGTVETIDILSCTLRVDPGLNRWDVIDGVLELLEKGFEGDEVFGKACNSLSTIVLPLLF